MTWTFYKLLFQFHLYQIAYASNDLGYLTLWKPLNGDSPGFAPLMHGVIIDPILLHFVDMDVVCTSLEVISFPFPF